MAALPTQWDYTDEQGDMDARRAASTAAYYANPQPTPNPQTPPTLPFATASQGAPAPAPSTPNATAGQGLSPTQPHPLATSDPLAFAPAPGSTLPIATTPSTAGGAPGMAPNGASDFTATPSAAPMNPALSVNGGASLATGGYQGMPSDPSAWRPAGSVGWDDPAPVRPSSPAPALSTTNQYATTQFGTPPNDDQLKYYMGVNSLGPQYEQQNDLGSWWAAHGTGPRYTTGPGGVQIDNATIGYNAQKGNVANGSLPSVGTGFNANLDAEAAGGVAKAKTAAEVGTGVGANPTGIVPMSPTDAGGIKAQPTGPTARPPSGGGGATLPAPAAGGGGTSTVPPNTSGSSYGGPTPLGPSTNPNDLTNTTLKRDPSIDRFALAKQNLTDWDATTNPQYEADLRDANRYAFANGRGYSGIENNAIGDIASQRDTARRGEKNTLLNKALNDTIGDQFNDLGIATQQQGYQAGRSDTGFEQGLKTEQQKQAEQQQGFSQDIQKKQLDNLLQNTAFGQQMSVQQLQDFENSTQFQQALQQFYAGQISDPAQYFEQLAQQWAKPTGGGY